MSKGLHQRTVFAGCARDCAASLPCVLANLAQMATLVEEAAFIFVEDGSVDDTRDLLLAWCRNRPQARVISADSQSPLRTVRLAAARNAYTALARTEFGHFDYLIALDMDEVNVAGFAPDALPRALDFLDGNGLCAGVFANTDGFYYDMWALRQREQCPGDVWEEVCDRVLATGASDEAAYDATLHRRIFHLPPDAAPLAVDSAFGGFGLYRMSSLLANTREFVGERRKILPPPMAARVAFADAGGAVGWQCCEHVTFHAGLRENGGQLFILPYLINYRSAFRDFNPQAWRGLLFDLRPSVPLPAGSIARNQSCPCGSGRRYKHCHGALG